jgi:hypothetical protein
MSSIHSVIFDSSVWDTTTAKQWLKDHRLTPIKRVHRTNNTLRYRLIDPSEFNRFSSKKLKNNITIVFGYI